MALARLLYEFAPSLAGLVPELLPAVLMLLRSKAREVIKSVLGFVKVRPEIEASDMASMHRRWQRLLCFASGVLPSPMASYSAAHNTLHCLQQSPLDSWRWLI